MAPSYPSHPKPTAGFGITLTLPAPKQLPVLVVDDNADWIELLKRYAAGSRYQIVGTREPASARSLAEKVQPAVILLDVMMHNVDGWQLLSELRHEPATASHSRHRLHHLAGRGHGAVAGRQCLSPKAGDARATPEGPGSTAVLCRISLRRHTLRSYNLEQEGRYVAFRTKNCVTARSSML